MKTVITGAAGFLGWHFRCRLSVLEKWNSDVVALDRDAFNDDATLDDALNSADVVIHCAGVNRGTEKEQEEGNIALARRLVSRLASTNSQPHLVYTNSTHKRADNAYGRGKSGADEIFKIWSEAHGSRYTELVLPHIFGECGRPFYNSAIFTFCYQLVNGESLEVNKGGQLELLHAQDVCLKAISAVEEGQTGELRLLGRHITVEEAAARLSDMFDRYENKVIPNFADRLDLQLFNTLRSFMYPASYPGKIALHEDERGSLFEAVKTDHGGQAFLSTTKPNVTRGNHFHFDKVERFLVVSGEAEIRLRRLFDDQVVTFSVSGKKPVFIDMPPLHTHSITNTGTSELMTLFWSHEIFDAEKPDTYFLPVYVNKDVER